MRCEYMDSYCFVPHIYTCTSEMYNCFLYYLYIYKYDIELN